MPIKITKGKEIIFGQKEYDSIKKVGDFYILKMDANSDTFTETQKLEFCQMIIDKKSKGTICKHFDISEHLFSATLKRWFATSKISDVRDILKEELTKKKFNLSNDTKPEIKPAVVVQKVEKK